MFRILAYSGSASLSVSIPKTACFLSGVLTLVSIYCYFYCSLSLLINIPTPLHNIPYRMCRVSLVQEIIPRNEWQTPSLLAGGCHLLCNLTLSLTVEICAWNMHLQWNIYILTTSLAKRGYVFRSIGLSNSEQHYSKSYGQIAMKFYGEVLGCTRNN